MSDETERVVLSREDANKLLVPGDHVHTFVTPGAGGILLGCDVSREKLLSAEILELTGEQAANMKHGVAAYLDGRWLFCATANTN